MVYKYLIKRPKDTVEVIIMPHKDTGKFSFVNLTKNHICPCQFNSIEDAINEMDRLKTEGKIIEYKLIDNKEKTSSEIYNNIIEREDERTIETLKKFNIKECKIKYKDFINKN